jgi:hypothetical protein
MMVADDDGASQQEDSEIKKLDCAEMRDSFVLSRIFGDAFASVPIP